MAGPWLWHEGRNDGSKCPVPLLLLVDDDPLMAEGLEMLLGHLGFTTRAPSHSKIVSAIRDHRPDAAILSLTSDLQRGTAMVRTLHARWPNLPIIVTTGHPNFERLPGELQERHIALLRKPYPAHDLLATIRKVLGLRRRAEEEGRLRV